MTGRNTFTRRRLGRASFGGAALAGATLLGSSPGGDGGALWSSAFAGVVGAGAVF